MIRLGIIFLAFVRFRLFIFFSIFYYRVCTGHETDDRRILADQRNVRFAKFRRRSVRRTDGQRYVGISGRRPARRQSGYIGSGKTYVRTIVVVSRIKL